MPPPGTKLTERFEISCLVDGLPGGIMTPPCIFDFFM